MMNEQWRTEEQNSRRHENNRRGYSQALSPEPEAELCLQLAAMPGLIAENHLEAVEKILGALAEGRAISRQGAQATCNS